MKNKDILIIGGLFLVIAILLFIVPHNVDYIKNGKLYISEVMPSNYSTIADNHGGYSDYIELYNSSNVSINLQGYYISDSEYETSKWKFPNIEIKPKEYLVIYASGLDECDIENRICHTNFKLSSKGEIITLSDNGGNIINKFEYPSLSQDVSYGYKKGKYIVFETPTPGQVNNSGELKSSKSNAYTIEINEYMTHNTRYNYDSHGNYYDWVELYNYSKKDVTLENVYISDDEKHLKKYKLPKTIIKSDTYLLIYFSKEKVHYDDAIYVPFALSDNDFIILSDENRIIDKVKVVKLYDNVSYGKVNGDFKYFTYPTPGKVNNTAYFDKIGGTNGSS